MSLSLDFMPMVDGAKWLLGIFWPILLPSGFVIAWIFFKAIVNVIRHIKRQF